METIVKKPKKKKPYYVNISSVENGVRSLFYMKNKKMIDDYIKLKNIVSDYNSELRKNKFEFNLLRKLLHDGYGIDAYYPNINFDDYQRNKKTDVLLKDVNIYDYCDEDFEEVVREILEKMKILKNISLTYKDEIHNNIQEIKEIKRILLDKKVVLV